MYLFRVEHRGACPILGSQKGNAQGARIFPIFQCTRGSSGRSGRALDLIWSGREKQKLFHGPFFVCRPRSERTRAQKEEKQAQMPRMAQVALAVKV